MDKKQILAALQANMSTRAGTRLVSNRVYTIHLDGDITHKLPPQAQALLKVIFEDDRMSFTEPELYDVLSVHTAISKKQTPWEVFRFYRPVFEKAGWMTVRN